MRERMTSLPGYWRMRTTVRPLEHNASTRYSLIPRRKVSGLLFYDNLCKFLVINRPIAVAVHLLDHLLDIFESHWFAHIDHDAAHFLCIDESIARRVKHRKRG